MIRSLVKLAVILLACVLVYNYFFGTDDEKDQSRAFFGKVKEVVVAGAGVLKSEKQKFDAGKYDKLMGQLDGAYRAIRQQAQHVDQKVLKRLDELEQRRSMLQQELDDIQAIDQQLPSTTQPVRGLRKPTADTGLQTSKEADQQRRKIELQKQMEQLFQDSETLLKEASEQ